MNNTVINLDFFRFAVSKLSVVKYVLCQQKCLHTEPQAVIKILYFPSLLMNFVINEMKIFCPFESSLLGLNHIGTMNW